LTINKIIELLNQYLDIDMPTYTQVWGDYPISFVQELIKAGKLTELGPLMIEETTQTVDTPLPDSNQPVDAQSDGSVQ